MIKRIFTISLILLLSFLFAFSVCAETVENKEITLYLSFGKRTGSYTGVWENDLPNGAGVFTSKNSDGKTWVYTGNFIDGHFNGEGTTVWESGEMQVGHYEDDVLNGYGKYYDENGSLVYEGNWINGEYENQPASSDTEDESNILGGIFYIIFLIVVAVICIVLAGFAFRFAGRAFNNAGKQFQGVFINRQTVTQNPPPYQSPPPQPPPPPPTQRIDLNTCSEQEMVNLPGVSVVLAKRAVEMREQTGGFMSVQDFCKQLGLMPHFAVQIENLAFVTPIQHKTPPSENKGRVIDI